MDDPPLTPERVVTTISQVLSGERKVAVVEHEATGEWMFRPAGSYYATDMVDVPFADLLRVEPDLADLTDLPPDWVASRRSSGQPWRRRWIYEDTRYLWDEQET